jgi:hypothetical protein
MLDAEHGRTQGRQGARGEVGVLRETPVPVEGEKGVAVR